jgi:hypothetical protein
MGKLSSFFFTLTMSLPTPLDQLPEDVLRELCHYMGLSHVHDLSSLRLSCRTLAEALSPFSFTHVILRTEQRAQTLVDLCQSNTRLLFGTQKMTIGDPEQHDPTPRVTLWEWLATSEGMQLLDGFNRVSEVCLCQFSPRHPARLKTTPNKALISVILRIGTFTHVRHLTIRWSELIAPDIRLFFALTIFSHLDSLVFEDSGLDMITARRIQTMTNLLSHSETISLHPSQLQLLAITGCKDPQSIVQTLIANCRFESLSTLKITWGARFQPETISTLLGHVASSLRYLTVDIRYGHQTYNTVGRSSLVRLETLDLIEHDDTTSSYPQRPSWHQIYSAFKTLLPKGRKIDRIAFQIVVPAVYLEDVVPFLQSHAFLDNLAMTAREIDLAFVLGPNIISSITPEMRDEWVRALMTMNVASGTITRCTIQHPSTNTNVSWSPNAYPVGE